MRIYKGKNGFKFGDHDFNKIVVPDKAHSFEELLDFLEHDLDLVSFYDDPRNGIIFAKVKHSKGCQICAKGVQKEKFKEIEGSADPFEKYSKDSDWEIRRAVVTRGDCPVRIISKLTSDENENVVAAALSNLNCPVEVRESFANSPKVLFRCMVAGASNTSSEILRVLGGDEDEDVLGYVGANPSTPEDVLNFLLDVVPEAVASNINCSPEIFNKLSSAESINVQKALAGNINCPFPILEKLSSNSFWKVRVALANNPSVTRELLVKLLDCNDSSVIAVVKEVLAKRGDS